MSSKSIFTLPLVQALIAPLVLQSVLEITMAHRVMGLIVLSIVTPIPFGVVEAVRMVLFGLVAIMAL